jgi:hypothetical protein
VPSAARPPPGTRSGSRPRCETAVSEHAAAIAEREATESELIRLAREAGDAKTAVIQCGIEVEQAQQRITEARPSVASTQRRLRTLVETDGVHAVLFEPAALPPIPEAIDTDESIAASVGYALSGGRTISRRALRERYDTCRVDLAGLWTLDPGDTVEDLDTYLLTHDGAGYAPSAAAEAGRRLRDRAQAALNRAEESALRDFVIGRLPLAIGTAWVSIEDWIKDVNRKMQKAAASSGVGVRIAKALARDLSAVELTVYQLACKGSVLTAGQQVDIEEHRRSTGAATNRRPATSRKVMPAQRALRGTLHLRGDPDAAPHQRSPKRTRSTTTSQTVRSFGQKHVSA